MQTFETTFSFCYLTLFSFGCSHERFLFPRSDERFSLGELDGDRSPPPHVGVHAVELGAPIEELTYRIPVLI